VRCVGCLTIAVSSSHHRKYGAQGIGAARVNRRRHIAQINIMNSSARPVMDFEAALDEVNALAEAARPVLSGAWSARVRTRLLHFHTDPDVTINLTVESLDHLRRSPDACVQPATNTEADARGKEWFKMPA
jgi:hypothetical protein